MLNPKPETLKNSIALRRDVTCVNGTCTKTPYTRHPTSFLNSELSHPCTDSALKQAERLEAESSPTFKKEYFSSNKALP